MRRLAAAGMAIVLIAGLVVLAVAGAGTTRPSLQDLGVVPAGPVVLLKHGHQACQTPIGLAEWVDRVAAMLGPFDTPGGPVDVSLRRGGQEGRMLAAGVVPAEPLPSGASHIRL